MKTMSEKKYRKYVNILTALAVFSCILIFFIPSSFAEDKDDLPIQMAEAIVEGTSSVILGTIGDPNYPDSGYPALYGEVTSTNVYVGVNGTMSAVMNSKILRYIAMSWAIVIVLSHIALNIGKEQDKVECIFKGMFELCVTMILLIKVQDIIGMALKLGHFILNGGDGFDGILTAISQSAGGGGVTATDYLDAACGGYDGGKLEWVYCVLMMFLPWVISLALNVFARFIMLELIIEIAIRRAFAPLAMVEVYKDGLRSPGFKFLTKLFACFLKVAMYAFISSLVLSLGASVLSDLIGSGGHIINGTFAFIAINFAGLGAMKKAGDYANEVVGV